eukprot:GHVR01132668.1.p1 GENE.GHVR01132668.1~~GHVR01132668.1.p1  ORF type:complete len:157 (-),score=18.07 GHVR01132668.1:83-553(-)
MVVDDDKLMCASGPTGDRNQFCNYMQKNVHLYRYQTDSKLGATAMANFIQSQLAYSLRRSPYHVDALIAGVDDGTPVLFWIDYFASMVKVNTGSHGYAAMFINGILDCNWKPDMREDEALALAQLCIAEIGTRFLISQTHFIAKIVNKDGTKVVPI